MKCEYGILFFKNFGKYDKIYDKLKKILYKYSKLYMKKNMDIANIMICLY